MTTPKDPLHPMSHKEIMAKLHSPESRRLAGLSLRTSPKAIAQRKRMHDTLRKFTPEQARQRGLEAQRRGNSDPTTRIHDFHLANSRLETITGYKAAHFQFSKQRPSKQVVADSKYDLEKHQWCFLSWVTRSENRTNNHHHK
jgi:hypothetical protein